MSRTLCYNEVKSYKYEGVRDQDVLVVFLQVGRLYKVEGTGRTLKRADSEHALEIVSVSKQDVEDVLLPGKKSRGETVLHHGRYLRV